MERLILDCLIRVYFLTTCSCSDSNVAKTQDITEPTAYRWFHFFLLKAGGWLSSCGQSALAKVRYTQYTVCESYIFTWRLPSSYATMRLPWPRLGWFWTELHPENQPAQRRTQTVTLTSFTFLALVLFFLVLFSSMRLLIFLCQFITVLSQVFFSKFCSKPFNKPCHQKSQFRN